MNMDMIDQWFSFPFEFHLCPSVAKQGFNAGALRAACLFRPEGYL
jgi:hypothetical protein